jgi:hypothetical protein
MAMGCPAARTSVVWTLVQQHLGSSISKGLPAENSRTESRRGRQGQNLSWRRPDRCSRCCTEKLGKTRKDWTRLGKRNREVCGSTFPSIETRSCSFGHHELPSILNEQGTPPAHHFTIYNSTANKGDSVESPNGCCDSRSARSEAACPRY